MTNHFLRNFSLPGCFIAVLFFQENAIFAFCMSCVLYALIWFFYSKCIKKYFLFHKNNIFSISQKSLSGDFLQKTWFQKKMIQCFCFYFLIIFYVSHFRAHYFIQSDVAGKYFDYRSSFRIFTHQVYQKISRKRYFLGNCIETYFYSSTLLLYCFHARDDSVDCSVACRARFVCWSWFGWYLCLFVASGFLAFVNCGIFFLT